MEAAIEVASGESTCPKEAVNVKILNKGGDGKMSKMTKKIPTVREKKEESQMKQCTVKVLESIV
jgi:hypothetical protein